MKHEGHREPDRERAERDEDARWLVVADASLFPQTPRATTNLPTLVAAARVAEWLSADGPQAREPS